MVHEAHDLKDQAKAKTRYSDAGINSIATIIAGRLSSFDIRWGKMGEILCGVEGKCPSRFADLSELRQLSKICFNSHSHKPSSDNNNDNILTIVVLVREI